MRNDVEGVDVESGDDEFARATVSRTKSGLSQQRRSSAISLEWHSRIGHPSQKLVERMKKGLGLEMYLMS